MKRVLWAMSLLVAITAPAGAATAQATLSPGCQALSDPVLDGQYHANSIGPLQFFAGDQVIVKGDQPAPSTTPATSIELRIGDPVFDTLVDQKPFPGTLAYTFPAGTITGVSWYAVPEIVEGTATRPVWTVSCIPAAYPLAVFAPQPADGVDIPAVAVDGGVPPELSLGTVALVAGTILLNVGLCAAALRRRTARLVGRPLPTHSCSN